MSLHPCVIIANIEQTTAGAMTRRAPKRVWPTAALAVLALAAMLAVVVAL